MNRRAFLSAAFGGMGAACAYGLGYEPSQLTVERVRVSVRGRGTGIDGFKIVALSDFHLHPFTKLDFLKQAFAVARELQPDLVVMLGDYVDLTVDAIDELVPALSTLDARFGVFAVLGNHDFMKGPTRVAEALTKGGVGVLRNRAVSFDVGESALWLGGLDSCWGQPDQGEVFSSLPRAAKGVVSVLLAHEPDIADEISRIGGVQLQLSGHSHGGQVNVPGLVHSMLPRMGKKYAFGGYQVGDLFVHTSRGIGMTGVPVRFRSPPEVTEIILTLDGRS